MKSKGIAREPIATWWKVHSFDPKIVRVEVVAFTPSYVTFISEWVGKKQEIRESRNDIFPTFSEAKEEAIRRADVRVRNAVANLDRERSLREKWQSLKEPNPDGHTCEYHPLSGDEEKRCFVCQNLMSLRLE